MEGLQMAIEGNKAQIYKYENLLKQAKAKKESSEKEGGKTNKEEKFDRSKNLVGKNVWVTSKGDEWKVYVLQDKGEKLYIHDPYNKTQGWVSRSRVTGLAGKEKSTKDNAIPDGQDKPDTAGEEKAENKGKEKMADKKTMDADKREAIREVMAIAGKPDTEFEGGEEEKIETIAKLLEKSEYSKSEAGTANDEDPDEADKDKLGEDKCGKDEDEEEKEDDKKDKPSEDEDEDEEEEEKGKKAEDAMPRQIMKMIAKRDALVKQVEPLIGSFACDEMTEQDTAVYACRKLGLQVSQKEALPCLRGYLAAQKSNKSFNKVYGLDSAISAESGVDRATQKYLKGE